MRKLGNKNKKGKKTFKKEQYLHHNNKHTLPIHENCPICLEEYEEINL